MFQKADQRALAFWVCLLAFAVRIPVLLFVADRVPVGDPAVYVELARNVLAGQGLVTSSPVPVPGLRALYPPAYPLLLAVVGVLLPLKAATFLAVNFLIDLATALAMLWLGRLAAAQRAAFVAVALYLLWPTNFLLSPLAHKEGLVCLLAVCSAALLLESRSRPRRQNTVALGIIIGLLALTQPVLAPLPFGFALFLTPKERALQWLRMMVAVASVAALVLLPWWVRNWLLFGDFIPLTTSLGLSLWIGANPAGSGAWLPPAQHLLNGSELQIAAAAQREAWGWIAADPVGYVWHCLSKIPLAFTGDYSALGRLIGLKPHADIPLFGPLVALQLLLPTLLLAAALVSAAIHRGSVLARLLLVGLAQILVFQIWFEFSERHRLFLNPFLMLLAALVAARWNQPPVTAHSGDAAHHPA